MRWKWAILLVVITLVLAGVWALPYVLPDQDLRLNELNQLAGVASLAVATAALFVGMWSLTDRSPSPNDPPTTEKIKKALKNREKEITDQALYGPDDIVNNMIPIMWTQKNMDASTKHWGHNKCPDLEANSDAIDKFILDLNNKLTQKRIILSGQPGMGKSTFAALASRAIYSRNKEERNEHPFPVSLNLSSLHFIARDKKLPHQEEFLSALTRTLKKEMHTESSRVATLEAFNDLLRNDDIILILDGLEDLREEYRKKVLHFLDRNIDLQFILTTQPSDYWDTPHAGGLRNSVLLTAQSPSEEERIRYIKNISSADNRNKEKWDEFTKRLTNKKNSPAHKYLCTPMRLWLLKETHSSPDSNPSNLLNSDRFPNENYIASYLYKSLIRSNIESWLTRRAKTWPWRPIKTFPYKEEKVIRSLGFLAAAAHNNGDSDIRWWKLPGSDDFTEERARSVLAAATTLLVCAWPIIYILINPTPSSTTFTHQLTEFFIISLFVFVIARFLAWTDKHPRSYRKSLRKKLLPLKPTYFRFILLLFVAFPFLDYYVPWSSLQLNDGAEPQIGHYVKWVIAATALATLIFDIMTVPIETGRVTTPKDSLREDFKSSFSVAMTAATICSLGVLVVVAMWLLWMINLPNFPRNELLSWESDLTKEFYSFAIVSLTGLPILFFVSVFTIVFIVWCFSSAWFSMGAFVAYLWIRGLLPLRIFSFFDFMVEINLLRPLGATYRFRHSEFKIFLLEWHNNR